MIEVPMIRTYTCIQFQYVNVSKWIVCDSSSEDHEYLHKLGGGLVSADNNADIPRSLLLEHMKSTIFALYCVHVCNYVHTHTHK